MDATTLRKLQAADDSRHWDCPPDFDWQEAMGRVRSLQPMLEAIAGRPLSLDDQVQDASYFADLCVLEPDEKSEPKHMKVTFSICFSCFGSLVTIVNEHVVPDERVVQIQSALESQGFAVVDPESLREPYTGSHTGFQGSTWLDRFFNYT